MLRAPGSKRRRAFMRSLRIAGYLVAIWLIASWAVAYKLTQRRHRPFEEPTPVVAWARFEGQRLRTSDGHEIGAWFAPGRDDGASVLLIHGNGGSRAHCLGRAELVAGAGCSTLLISLRAHGDSTGEFNDIGYGARADVAAAVDFLARRRPGKPIVILGTSLGAAAALFAAEGLGHRVAGYILESPYQDLRVAVRNRTENELPPVLDWIAYRGLLAVAPLVVPDLDRIAPVEAIAKVPAEIPILILAGEEDRSARSAEAAALLDRARSHAELHLFPAAGHLQMLVVDPARYRRAVLDFIARASTGAPRSR